MVKNPEVYASKLRFMMERSVKYGQKSEIADKFCADLENFSLKRIMPLTEDETMILRYILSINSDNSYKNEYQFSIYDVELEDKIANIFHVLQNYFSRKFQYSVPLDNISYYSEDDLTIFDVGLTQCSLNLLRIINAYYLKDVAHRNISMILGLIGDEQYNVLHQFMEEHAILFDEEHVNKRTV